MAKLLIANGANVNAKDKDGEGSLHVAALNGEFDYFKYKNDKTAIELIIAGNKCDKIGQFYYQLLSFLFPAIANYIAVLLFLKEVS